MAAKMVCVVAEKMLCVCTSVSVCMYCMDEVTCHRLCRPEDDVVELHSVPAADAAPSPGTRAQQALQVSFVELPVSKVDSCAACMADMQAQQCDKQVGGRRCMEPINVHHKLMLTQIPID